MRPTVIKLGGAALDDPTRQGQLLDEVAAAWTGGEPVVLVHGGGPAVSAMAERLGVESSFHQGLRVTSPELMAVAQMVQVGVMCRNLVTGLARRGVRAIGMSGADHGGFLRAELHPEPLLGRVGGTCHIDVAPVQALLRAGVVPVISPVAVDEAYEPLNVNADTVAHAVAVALGAPRLRYVSDVAAVNGPQGPVDLLPTSQARAWIADGTIAGGMRPKIEGALEAVASGVGEVVIGRTRVIR